MKNVQCHMFTLNCHMTRAVYFLSALRGEDGSIKAPKENVSKVS